jgi:hypothetical protein
VSVRFYRANGRKRILLVERRVVGAIGGRKLESEERLVVEERVEEEELIKEENPLEERGRPDLRA